MGTLKIRNYNFVLDLFEEGRVPPIYCAVQNERTPQQDSNIIANKGKFDFSGIIEVKCIPEFLTPVTHQIDQQIKMRNIQRFNGYYIDLTGYTSVDDYMRTELGSKRKSLKRQLRRLESCFDINYKVYFGEIKKDNYEFLFGKMQEFINTRFEQKGVPFDPTIDLDAIRKRTFSMILEKKASLHVIYNGTTPINVGIAYHFQDVLNSAIGSYDINYSKFGLGNLEIIKHLEWCLENGYQIYDLMWGDLPYKHTWCNGVFRYNHQIFYNRKSIFHRLLVPIRVYLYGLKDYYTARKNRAKGRKKLGTTNTKQHIEILQINKDHIQGSLLKETNIHHDSNHWLIPLVYDFQYLNVQHSNDVAVYELTNKTGNYVVIGKNDAISISRNKL
ncbi:GNAT family N-acetyltransferase [Flagellimonas flava]|uniref:Acetyltransferase (GNAT) domain-containing protein n=1 Tax=Flagellimonas flava TaxID=570519 RepID=A0A1M5J9B1_9FLAO|nr:GNAT family N-acetyltransferase [Allomuricauda flava]SHG36593.1 Acetyltransferase (GNAT) domain-containing protein [Allomuricauda flava]